MTNIKLIVFLVLVAFVVWGCVEELTQGYNRSPNVWITRGPSNGEVIFQNSVDFEWMATDYDDDLGMGASYVRLVPHEVPWVNTDTGSTIVFRHPEGWVRLYENNYQILDLPDTSFQFSVRIVDGRGADSTVSRRFVVRYDDLPPIIDSVTCPGKKPPKIFPWIYTIYARDVARSARAATPWDSLEYYYRFKTPCRTYESDPEWSRENRVFQVFIDGQTCPGEYVYRCKVRDRAMNVTEEFKCDFRIDP